MRLIALQILAGSALLAACAASPVENGEPSSGPPEPAPPAWRCDAEAARSLIGSHVGAVTFPQDSNVRMVCTTCAMTRDYQADRLNLIFDQETGVIEEVSCG